MRAWIRELGGAVPLFVAVVGIGIVGYRWIEGWSWLDCLWMVVITLTTVGFGEVAPLSPAGRAFTLALIFGGLGVYSYALGRGSRYVLGGGLARDMARRRRRRDMAVLTDHTLVVGFGRLGREVAADLVHAGRSVVLIDPDEAAIERGDAKGFVTVRGDAGRDAVLVEAGILRAEGIAIATASNAVNVLVTLSARQLNPDLRIWTRVDSEEAASKAMRAGASGVLSPYGLGGAHMALGLLRPQAHTFLALARGRDHGALAFEDVTVGAGAQGRLRSLRLRERFGILVVAVQTPDGTMTTVPGPDTEIHLGDVLVSVGRPEDLARFAEAAR